MLGTPTVLSETSVVVLVELEGMELVAAEEEVPVIAESGAPKSVLVPVGTFVGRTLGGWDVISSRPATGACDWEDWWAVVPGTPVFDVLLSPSL